MKRLFTVFLPFLISLFIAQQASAEMLKQGDISIHHTVIRAGFPGSKVTAGYLELTNNGASDDQLISVQLEGAGKSELHSMEVDNGVMKMRPLKDGITLPAGETVTLAPGGLHLMFMQLDAMPKEGEARQLTLVFEKAGSISFSAPVKKIKMGHNHKKKHKSHEH